MYSYSGLCDAQGQLFDNEEVRVLVRGDDNGAQDISQNRGNEQKDSLENSSVNMGGNASHQLMSRVVQTNTGQGFVVWGE